MGSYTVLRGDHKGLWMGYKSVIGGYGSIGGFIVAIGRYGAIGKWGDYRWIIRGYGGI